MKLSIVMPVFNERNTIKEILRRVRQVDLGDLEREIVIVDDCSSDGTRDILAMEEDSGTRVMLHPENQGKGAAVRTGFAAATGDMIIVQDADLEYDPEDYPKLIEPVLKGKAQVVYGSRFTGPRKNMLFWHFVGNRFLALVTNVLYNTTLSDMETCYKLFTREALEGIEIKSDHFDFEPEITAKILKKRIRIFEVPISYAGREMEEGKKITWRDGAPALWALIKYRFVD
jgi:glycosyltransferase involved in cell wall biosynthesis